MQLSQSPDLGATRRLAVVALLVAAGVCAMFAWKYHVTARLGDTDDAMRLFLVRDLLSGRGWYDQWIGRLQPPHGVYFHWSRLLDGGLAGMIWFFEQFTTPAWAEWTTRLVWPLAWIFPLVAGALVIARNLGGRSAVLLTTPLLLINTQIYRQFIPGRVDHHNIQIVMTVLALACALARQQRTRWAAVGGVAAGLGLAIGLEALPLQALIGASYGLELARDRKAAGPAGAYGLALAVSSALFFAVQTPPWRWSLSFCDAIALNLVAALAVAGLGLVLAAAVAGRAPAWARLALLAGAGAAAAGTYLALAPACVHGPFAAVDPAVKPFWMNHIQEMQPLPAMFKRERLAAIIAGVTTVMSLAASGWLLARRWRSLPTANILVFACMLAASIEAWFAWRLQDYVFAIGIPVLGAAISLLAARWLRDLMVPSLVAAVVLTPTLLSAGADEAQKLLSPKSAAAARPAPNLTAKCSSPWHYRALAALPAGEVMSETDLGPYILVFTRHSALAAPYHRMSWGILAAHRAFDAPPAEAQTRVRGLGVTYVMDCPPYPMMVGPASFGARLRAGEVPSWLEALSAPGDTLKIYRVRPASPSH